MKFKDGKVLQAVPVAPGEARPSLLKISAKSAARLARQQGSAAWFALIRGPNNVQTGLLASTTGSSDPLVAAPPQFKLLVEQYSDVFVELHEPAPGQVTHRIDLHDELANPPRQHAYRTSPAEMAESRRQIEKMLEKGWIRLSSSLYGAPLLFVHKKSRELRMCIDYRMLNK